MNPLRHLFRPAVLAGSLLLAQPCLQAADLFPFVLPWDDASESVTNISAWLDKPAGAAGFVTARDGHLFAGAKRVRFLGVNLAFGGNFPTHEDAEKVAARMAKFGINCVRFHHMDTASAPVGIVQKDKKTLDPDSLDRLDYFIAALKKNGIYTNLNLHVGLEYPGMEKWDGAPSYFKGVDNFYPPMIEQQRAFARALLTHVNPYTGKAYSEEPAVAFIEINNENGLIMEWNNGSLDGMPAAMTTEFGRQWNAWLKGKYGTHEKLAAAWNEGAEPLGEEMLKPDGKSWFFEQHQGAQATHEWTGEAADKSLHIKVTIPGPEAWHVQIGQSGLQFTGGKTYTVAFRAKASEARKMTVGLSQAHAPWKVLAGRDVRLTTEWQEIRFSVPVNDSDAAARLSLTGLGSAPGEVWFSAISLRPGGIIALNEGEQLGNIPAFRKKEIGGRTLAAQRDWNAFLVDAETQYWTGMQRYVRDELKARSLIFGTASGFSPWIVQQKLDVVDAHAYWQHPHFPRKQWDMNDWTVKNVSMAGAPDGGTLPGLALRRVAGKPFVVTEYNAASPNSFSSEAFLELCAAAGLQDWDGLFIFAYSHRFNEWDTKRFGSFFDVDQHPTKMATLPASAALFLRGDLQPAGEMAVAEVTPAKALESVRKGSSWVDAGSYGIPALEAFRRQIGMRLGTADKWDAPANQATDIVRSVHGQFTWDTKARRMLIAAPRSAGVVGSVQLGDTIELGPVRLVMGATEENWATVNATVMEGADFNSARRILITATGMSSNTGMQWKDAEKTSVGNNWGKAPSIVEGIGAQVSFPLLKNAKAWALDAQGQRRTEIPLEQTAERTQIDLSSRHKTLWWEIVVP